MSHILNIFDNFIRSIKKIIFLLMLISKVQTFLKFQFVKKRVDLLVKNLVQNHSVILFYEKSLCFPVTVIHDF